MESELCFSTNLPRMSCCGGVDLPSAPIRVATCRRFSALPQVAAFSQELSLAFAKSVHGTPKNIISLGDSVHERAALRKVRSGTAQPVSQAASRQLGFNLPFLHPT